MPRKKAWLPIPRFEGAKKRSSRRPAEHVEGMSLSAAGDGLNVNWQKGMRLEEGKVEQLDLKSLREGLASQSQPPAVAIQYGTSGLDADEMIQSWCAPSPHALKLCKVKERSEGVSCQTSRSC